jgi:outer membrane protein OmpA-like peptidoglycan-associated protein
VRWLVLPVVLVSAGLVSSCAMLRVEIPERPGQTLAVLLPDGDGDSIGEATVSNASGSTDLTTPRAATVASMGEAPSRAMRLSDSDVRRIFGDALAALPPAPQRFTLFFRFDSDALTDDSRSQVPEILEALKAHPVPELLIVGHTDTPGTRAANFDLGRKRAEMVRGLLMDAGLDASAIRVISHGESDLLVPTADEIFEPQNRRVDISVR